jgi:hypothetical protein
MKCTLSLLAIAFLQVTAHAADESKARELMSIMKADEFAARAMKAITLESQAEDGMTDAQVACIETVRASNFSDAVVRALSLGLDDAEALSAIAFYRTSTGRKLLNMLDAESFGTDLKEPLTAEDKAAIKQFLATSAGDKLVKKGIAVTSPVVTNRMKELSQLKLATCGK